MISTPFERFCPLGIRSEQKPHRPLGGWTPGITIFYTILEYPETPILSYSYGYTRCRGLGSDLIPPKVPYFSTLRIHPILDPFWTPI